MQVKSLYPIIRSDDGARTKGRCIYKRSYIFFRIAEDKILKVLLVAEKFKDPFTIEMLCEYLLLFMPFVQARFILTFTRVRKQNGNTNYFKTPRSQWQKTNCQPQNIPAMHFGYNRAALIKLRLPIFLPVSQSCC